MKHLFTKIFAMNENIPISRFYQIRPCFAVKKYQRKLLFIQAMTKCMKT